MARLKLLYVDDEPVNLTNFQLAFQRKYRVMTALSGEEALRLFDAEGDVAIVVADQRMPGMTGVELLHEVKRRNRDTVRIILTAYTDVNDIIDSINKGNIYQYILKPWEETDLEHLLRRAGEKFLLTRENRQLIDKLEDELEKSRVLVADILRRDMVLADVARMAVTLLLEKNWELHVEELIAGLGVVLAVSRVRIFQQYTDEAGELRAREKFAWYTEHPPGDMRNTGCRDFSYRDLNLERWAESFQKRELVEGNIQDFPEGELGLLQETQLKSIACVPITVGDDCWGFMSFEDGQVARRWPKAELDALVTSATLIGAAIHREKMEADISSQQAQLAHAGRLTALGEMSSGIGHEIHQPLSVINLTVESCLMHPAGVKDDDFFKDSLLEIKRQVEKVTRLVDGMRRFSRKKTGHRVRQSLFNPVNNVLIFYNEQFRANGIDFELSYGDDIPDVLCDGQKIEQLLVNFLSNAKYAVDERERRAGESEYGKKVRVLLDTVVLQNHETDRLSIKRDENISDRFVRLEVVDNGIGMDETTQKRCLEPFYTTKEVGEGTGLGLSVCHGIVQDLNYHLEVESREGEGTTFRLYIPVEKEELL